MICVNKRCARSIPDDAKYCQYCGRKQESTPKRKKRPNGTGSVYLLPNGKYKAVKVLGYYHSDGRLHRRVATKTFVRIRDAMDALPTLGQNKELVGPARDYTVAQLHNFYLDTRAYDNSSKSNKDKMQYAWQRSAHLSDRLITSITIDDIEDIIERENLPYYPARDVRTLWSHMYKQAIRRDINVPNKAGRVELPELKKPDKKIFTDKEVNIMWEVWATGNEFVGYILTMIYTGMRFGELARIQIEDIHLTDQYMVGGIKTEAGRGRQIPIASKLVPVIRKLIQSRKKKLLEMNEDSFYRRYYETLEQNNIQRISPHSCRHTYFTRMTAAGVQPGVIIAAGGHTDYETTQTYIHLPIDDLVAAVNMI